MNQQPTNAFIFASWVALLVGIVSYLIGLWNAEMWLSEKGFYFTVLAFGLFAAISVQKSVRDRAEEIAVTNVYYGLSWVATLLATLLLVIGLWNANLALSEKGFYGLAFTLSMFAVISVQKNIRDSEAFEKPETELSPFKLFQENNDPKPVKREA